MAKTTKETKAHRETQAVLLPAAKTANKFRVKFKDFAGTPIAHSDAALMNLVNVTGIAPYDFDIEFESQIAFMDDTQNDVVKFVKELKKRGPFRMEIEYLDGNENVLRHVEFVDAKFRYVVMSDLDYASADSLKIFVNVTNQGIRDVK